jgi:class 3 adenylate cyclase
MKCAHCGSDNPSDKKFCGDCGTPLHNRCPQCGADNPANKRFCGDCGASLKEVESRQSRVKSAETGNSRPPTLDSRQTSDPRSHTPKHLADKILSSRSALEGERKQVTVLFADVKGSMELAEHMDPEEWSAIMELFFHILSGGVERFEGFVDKFTGDGIMALFGAPIAHEDHAQRACYAALHLREALKAYADALRVDRGLNFSVRMGINSGEVVVGKIGDDLRMDYTAQGHTVGLAQRMEALAEPGKALLAGDTIDLIEGYFALRDLGRMKVKGVEAPVRVAELEGVGRMRTRLDRSRARGLSKFVGRDEEMERLEAALRRALAGDGQVIGVMAEAGAGKSRLCYEFLERCRARGITVRTATGVPHGRAVPLQPVLEFYREIYGITSEDSDAQARQKIAGFIAQMAPEELGSLPLLFDFLRVPDPSNPPPVLAPDERQRELIGLLRRGTAARARREPAVLVFEDLHWMDPESEVIVEGIVDAAAGTRTLLLTNFRPEYRAGWVGRTHYQQIALRPLDAGAAAELLADWLGGDPSLQGFAELVRERTGGNPFFMEEVVQAQIESGALAGVRGRFRLQRPIETLDLPPSVHSLLAARIDRLDDATKRLLQTAAVLGDQIAEPLLARVAGVDADTLRGSLRQLVQSEFLYEASLYPEIEYAFKHPVTREVAYGSLLRERRRGLHARAAETLETLAGAAADAQAALLAHHWEEAGQALAAARWQARAAERLGENAGESIFHWRKVIELLAVGHDSPEARALRGQARARLVYAAGRSGASEEEVAALFEAARSELGTADSRDLSLTLGLYGIVCNGAGRRAEARRLVDEAVAMGRRLVDREVLAATLANLCVVVNMTEAPEEVGRLIAEIEDLCAEEGALAAALFGSRPLVFARVLRSFQLTTQGRGSEQEPLLASVRTLLGDSQNALEQVLYHWASVNVRTSRGDTQAALEHGRQALEWAMRSKNLSTRALGHLARGHALRGAGRFDEAVEQLEQAKVIGIDGRVMRHLAPGILTGLAATELERGDAGTARRAAEYGIELSREMGLRHGEATCQVALARALVASQDSEAAEAALARAAQLAAATGARDLPPRLEEARAELAQLRGDTAGRERALRAVARLHRENGEEWLAAQAEASVER